MRDSVHYFPSASLASVDAGPCNLRPWGKNLIEFFVVELREVH